MMNNVIQLPVIAGIEITTDAEGRFNLNALHRASGLGKSKQPALWLRLDSTKELIEQFLNSTDMQSLPINTEAGRSGGTYAVKQLAVAYANWISPTFYLQVIDTFLDYKAGRSIYPTLPDFTDPAEAAVAWAKEFKAKQLAQRQACNLENQLGISAEWKQVKAMPWLSDFFILSKPAYQKIGCALSELSRTMGLNPRKIEDTEYGHVNAYHISVITAFRERLIFDVSLLSQFRKEAAA